MIGLTVTLKHAPNPDIDGGYWDEPEESGEARHVLVSSLAEAQQVAQVYRDRNNLGGGNWTGGQLMLDGKAIGYISYNGRAWKAEGVELEPTDPVLGVYAAKAKRARVRRHKGEEARILSDAEQARHEELLADMAAGRVDLASFVVPPPARPLAISED